MKRRSRTFSKGLVISDWMKYRSYKQPSFYDSYYLKLANSVLSYLDRPEVGFKSVFKREHLKELAILITCYFEDFISEIGLWRVLVRKHEELYGKPLPLFDLEGYDPAYLNPQDFAYLIWHHLGKMSLKTLAPFGTQLLEAADYFYDFFEERIDEAPATDFFSPGEGVMMSSLIPRVVSLLKKKKLKDEEYPELFYSFFYEFSPALAHYIAERYPMKNLRFPVGRDSDLAIENFDFFLRYFNPGDFREVLPNLSLLPEE